jgi:ABC-type multidrug transport system fused ATPase/permease subunit
MKQYLREISFLLGNDRKKIPWLIIIFIGSSFLDLAGLGLIGPYISLIIDPSLLLKGRMKDLIESLSLPLEQESLLIQISMILIGVFFVKTVVGILINRTIFVFSKKQQTRLKSALMDTYQNMPYSEYLKHNSADHVHTIQSHTNRFAGVIQAGLKTASDGMVGIVILAMLAWTNGPTLGFLLVLLVSMIYGYDRLFRNSIRVYGKQSNIVATKVLQRLHEGIEGLKEIRILGKEHYFHQKVHTGTQKVAEYDIKTLVLSTAPRFIIEFILIFFIVTMVVTSLLMKQDIHALIPTLGVFGVAALRLMPTANTISSSLIILRYNRHSVSRLYANLLEMEKIDSSSNNSSHQLKSNNDFRNYLVSNISFFYPNTKLPALKNLSIEIRKGESIGLIGTSGSGKTTLVDVLLGLLKPQEGELLYNGEQLDVSLNKWRSQVAYLPQLIFLIDDTLRRNVALGMEDDEIDDLKLNKALRQSRLSELVGKLPDGVNTMLGERGIRISGGQRQRIALARAFYHERNILIMDEATSSIDNETEQEIIEEIKHFKGKKTMIVIAHRLTTVEDCDRIYRLENGSIIKQGTYEEVIQTPKLVVNEKLSS